MPPPTLACLEAPERDPRGALFSVLGTQRGLGLRDSSTPRGQAGNDHRYCPPYTLPFEIEDELLDPER